MFYSSNRITVSIHTSGNADGKLTLRDMLGRTVATYNVYAGSGDERVVNINTDAFAKGVYIVTYEQSGAAVSQKVYLMQFGEVDTRRFLPEQWYACPFVPAYAFTVSNEYLSRWIGAERRFKAAR